MCGFTQDFNDNVDWLAHSGGTYTSNTGPPSSGFQAHGVYLLFEATSTSTRPVLPGDVARLVSPRLPKQWLGYKKCLEFAMNVHGQHIGSVNILDEFNRVVYGYIGLKAQNQDLKHWVAVSVQLLPYQALFVLEGSKGGEVEADSEGDICVDDFGLSVGECRKKYVEFELFLTGGKCHVFFSILADFPDIDSESDSRTL